MRLGNRIKALNQTLQSVAHWATRIEKDGISLRFLNLPKDDSGRFDGLTDPDQINELIYNIPIRGNTKLGTMLNRKVVQPLVQRAIRRKTTREKIKPRIILIITDGEPEGEYENCLRDQILEAKQGVLSEYGRAATIFIITRVGTNPQAMEFIESLSADDQVGDLILSANTRLEEVIERLASEEDKYGYQKYVSQLAATKRHIYCF
ncbi:hypothetical protein VTN77DRAFT_1116 [Rasamsonia byssochlamydoides]|uniref:uncharacterized protein n=1 Tax=Rasamsonia byssochlamydoides TaxID=89139 RepID=UPI0037437F8A